MNDARRTLRRWLLTALLERGCDPAAVYRRHHGETARVARPLTRAELRELAGPASRVRFFPSRRELRRARS